MDGRVILDRQITLWLGGSFLAYAGASLVWSPSLLPGSIHLLALAAAFGLGYWGLRPERIWWAFSVLCLALLPTCLFFVPAGVFGNTNYMGCAFALAIIAALTYRFFLHIPLLLFGLWYSQSRGAIAACGLTALIMLWPRYRATVFTILCLGLTVAMYKADIDSSMLTRFGIWQDTVNHTTIFGAGFDSFLASYESWPKHTNLTLLLAPHAYNDFLELVFCLGLGAIPLFVLTALCVEQPSPERPLIGCFLLLGLTYFPFWVPVIGQLFAFTLGHLSRVTVLSRVKQETLYEIPS